MSKPMDRRTMLKGAGFAVALPLLDAMIPASAAFGRNSKAYKGPMRFLGTGTPLGMHPSNFHPKMATRDYDAPRSLKAIEHLRNDFTVFSNLDHGLSGGHYSNHTLFSGVKVEEHKDHDEGNVTVDQRYAEHVFSQTRYSSLCLWNSDYSWTRRGVKVPAIKSTPHAFALLFEDTSGVSSKRRRRNKSKFSAYPEESTADLKARNSVLDAIRGDAKSLEARLGAADRNKLDEYFTSIREVERKLQSDIKWSKIPKPKVDSSPKSASNRDLEKAYESWYDLAYLAFKTDSTRSIVLGSPGGGNFNIPGVNKGYHDLSHHGHKDENIEQLSLIDQVHLRSWGRFVEKLKSTKEADGRTMLDSTITMLGSGMGDGARHNNENLPLVMAGGGWRHGSHVNVFKRQKLNSLYLSVLQRLGVKTRKFNTVETSFTGLK